MRRYSKSSWVCVCSCALVVAMLPLSCGNAVDESGLEDYPLIVADEVNAIPDSVRQIYQEDATRLAVRYMRGTGMNEVRIPTQLVGSILNGITRIYRATQYTARDSVFDLYRIHTFPSPGMYEIILLGVDTSCAWVANLRSGVTPTGETEVDRLLSEYGLTLKQSFGIGGYSHFLVLRSSGPLNTVELSKNFAGITCLTGAEENGIGGDGSDIRVLAEGEAWLFTFVLSWGDCRAGCIYSHEWSFRVWEDGQVEYVGERGDPIPVDGPQG